MYPTQVCMCPTPCDPMGCGPPGLSMEFSRQEYWSGLPFPPPGDLLDTGIKPSCLVPPTLAGGFFTATPPGKPPMVTLMWGNQNSGGRVFYGQ